MAEWHLQDLRTGLERRGWRIISEHDGNGRDVAATWELVRSPNTSGVLIDFLALNGDGNLLPLNQSYALAVRADPTIDLYFSKRGDRGSDARIRWQTQLATFLDCLETIAR
jgi:hypothetical protein